MIVGQDVSSWQGDIDWNTYKNNSNFVIIRSSYGNGYTDNKFFRNRDEARRVSLPRGFYHYAYPQYNSPEDECDWFLNLVGVQDGESLYLDYEENWSGDKVDWCKRFLDRMSSKLNGYKGTIYLNQSLASGNDWSPLYNAGYKLWIAAYTYDPYKNNYNIGTWPEAIMQQWTNQQQVPGIIGNVDGNVFFGDVNGFKNIGYKSPPPPTTSTSTTTTTSLPPPPPPPPQTTSTTTTLTPPPPPDYKSYLVRIKDIMYGRGFFWTKMANVKKVLTESQV